MINNIDFSQVFPVGAKVRCESEMWAGKWERGTVLAHLETRYGISWAIRIETEDVYKDGELVRRGAIVDYDYRFLDVDPHLSLVRLEK